jgi:hypothetical protein
MRYTLTIEAADLGRLRRCLKAMLRTFGVRVVEITEAETHVLTVLQVQQPPASSASNTPLKDPEG